jgi:hypothetical protein
MVNLRLIWIKTKSKLKWKENKAVEKKTKLHLAKSYSKKQNILVIRYSIIREMKVKLISQNRERKEKYK